MKEHLIKVAEKLFKYNQWYIGIIKKTEEYPSGLYGKLDTDNLKVLIPPCGHFFADPFIFKHNNKNYIFFEDFNIAKSRGVILFVEITEGGNLSKPVVALAEEYHLSYPFIFEWEDEILMIPESSQNKTIDMYRSVNFPYKWEKAATIMNNVIAADTTIFIYKGVCWLFTNILRPEKKPNAELFLYYSHSPYGKWVPHPNNPVINDIASARPAGRLFLMGNDIIRPGQDCLERYGRETVLKKVDKMNLEYYSESFFKRISCDILPQNLRTHTYNFNEDYEVFDLCRLQFDPFKAVRLISSKFHREVSAREISDA